jgi:hypothetical protein
MGTKRVNHWRRRNRPKRETRPVDLAGRRRQSTRNLDLEARHRHRRTVPDHPNLRSGVHVCELLPHTAKRMHHIALVRGINTQVNDHGKGAYIMHTGRPPEPATEYPHLGAAMAKLIGGEDNPLPGYIHVSPRGGGGSGKQDSAFSAKYASIADRRRHPAHQPAASGRPGARGGPAAQRPARPLNSASPPAASREAEAYTAATTIRRRADPAQELFDDEEDPEPADRYGMTSAATCCCRRSEGAFTRQGVAPRSTTRTTRTSTSTSSNLASSTPLSPRCSTTWPTAACSTVRW